MFMHVISCESIFRYISICRCVCVLVYVHRLCAFVCVYVCVHAFVSFRMDLPFEYHVLKFAKLESCPYLQVSHAL